jgi:hypothetical protein
MLAVEIKSIPRARQTCLKGKEYMVKYKGFHYKEAVWMKHVYLDHWPKMVNKFEQERGHELGVKRIQKKNPHLQMAKRLMKTSTSKVGENTQKINYSFK